ncbi:MAG: hypothetical protein JXJ04_20955 [Spirochaetales bacterium]|nr:hypothetical protein [Spirochaetales bacterium]
MNYIKSNNNDEIVSKKKKTISDKIHFYLVYSLNHYYFYNRLEIVFFYL